MKPVFEDTKIAFDGWTFPQIDDAFSTENLRPLLRAFLLEALDDDGEADWSKETVEQIDKLKNAMLSAIAETINHQLREDASLHLWENANEDSDGQPEIVVGLPLGEVGSDLFFMLPLSQLVDDFAEDLDDRESCLKFAAAFRGFADKLDAMAKDMEEE